MGMQFTIYYKNLFFVLWIILKTITNWRKLRKNWNDSMCMPTKSPSSWLLILIDHGKWYQMITRTLHYCQMVWYTSHTCLSFMNNKKDYKNDEKKWTDKKNVRRYMYPTKSLNHVCQLVSWIYIRPHVNNMSWQPFNVVFSTLGLYITKVGMLM